MADHEGKVLGMARECIPPKDGSPLTLGHFDAKYDFYLKFAHRHECVMVVRTDTEATGIFVFSHEALNQETPECYRIVKEDDELKEFKRWKEGGRTKGSNHSMDGSRRRLPRSSTMPAETALNKQQLADTKLAMDEKDAAIAALETERPPTIDLVAQLEARLMALEAVQRDWSGEITALEAENRKLKAEAQGR